MINENFSLARDLSLVLDEMRIERYRVSFREYKREGTSRDEWYLQVDVFVEVPPADVKKVEEQFRQQGVETGVFRLSLNVVALPYFACRIVSRQVAWGPRFCRALLALQRKRA